MFGINGGEMLILVVVALIVIGPSRLPEYTEKLRNLVRSVKRMAEGAKTQVKEDLGEDFDDIDWKKLDPRQYDPRRIVREALAEESASLAGEREALLAERDALRKALDDKEEAGMKPPTRLTPPQRAAEQASRRVAGTPAPFDAEAT